MAEQTKIPAPEPVALPEPVAMIGNDGRPRHILHVWGVGETRLYGPPRGLYRADQMETYAAALAEKARQEERERIAEFARSNPGFFCSTALSESFARDVLKG
jgi:hypothetical protein